MKQLIIRVWQFFGMLLSPPFCFYCRSFLVQRQVLCNACLKLIKPLASHTMQLSDGYVLTVHAVGDYQGPLRSLILAKARSDYTASKQLAYLMWQQSALKNLAVDIMLPVPLHWTRYIYRGYNQAHVLAQELSIFANKSLSLGVKRIKRTVFQSLLDALNRHKNVQGVFRVCPEEAQLYKDKTIIIIDDLMTTGATLSALAMSLIPYKPKEIHVLVASRVVNVCLNNKRLSK